MSSSHVIVLDSTFRRAHIKVTPGKHLSDVLQEACQKLGLDARTYGLKNNNKQIDLSLTMRLSGLSSGAKLELVQLSRSPAAVSVALQLPDSEAAGIPNGRLTDKFSSITTLWLILRHFESGTSKNGTSKNNFTARGLPTTTEGSGRLNYEQPVIQVIGRELATFEDLQKTLGQLGLNSGSVLLRLSFRRTKTPMEEAMVQIEEYFESVKGPASATSQPPLPPSSPDSRPGATPSSSADVTPGDSKEDTADTQMTGIESDSVATSESSAQVDPILDKQGRPIMIFAPPSNPTPHAALHPFNSKDYVPTVAHAQLHQSRLSSSTVNKRLPSEAELAAQKEEAELKAARVIQVNVKVRFPDQTTALSTFSTADTVEDLYAFVRGMLIHKNEPFALSFPSGSGKTVLRNGSSSGSDAKKKIIQDVGFKGPTLVNFMWDDATSPSARSDPVLKQQYVQRAQKMQVPVMPRSEEPEEEEVVVKGKEKDGKEKGERKGMPKWLKLPGKK